MQPAFTSGSMLDKALAVAQEENIYYYGSKTVKKQSIPTVQRTNFTQSLASKSGGQSVITISPDMGCSHFIAGFSCPAAAAAQPAVNTLTYSGMALPQAWAYHAIDYVQWRYGSSSLYQKSGAQLLVEAIATAGSQSEAQNLMTLAGNALTSKAVAGAPGVYDNSDFAGDRLNAYAVIPLPHCGAQSGTEVPNPFPTELLSAPIVITIALKRPQDFFITATDAAGVPAPPAVGGFVYPVDGFSEAYLQVRQINALDRGKLHKITGEAYAFPSTFFQQVNSVEIPAGAGDKEIVLTGFRSGSCKGVHCWVVDPTDNKNPFRFLQPKDAVLSYAGNVIHNYKGTSSQLLDTLFVDVPSYWDSVKLSSAVVGGIGVFTAAAEKSAWMHFPLSQRFEQLSAQYTETTGVGIANGVMNLRLKAPTDDKKYILYFCPYYSTALLFNSGSCEYVF